MVREPIEQRSGHLGIAERLGPFAEAEIGGDDDAGALEEFAEQMEQRCTARWDERQIPTPIENDQTEAQKPIGKLAGLVRGLFLLKRIAQIRGSEEPHLIATMLGRLNTERCCDMALSGTRPADQHGIIGTIDELAAVEVPDHGFVHLAGRTRPGPCRRGTGPP